MQGHFPHHDKLAFIYELVVVLFYNAKYFRFGFIMVSVTIDRDINLPHFIDDVNSFTVGTRH